jgi:hypothetical protein
MNSFHLWGLASIGAAGVTVALLSLAQRHNDVRLPITQTHSGVQSEDRHPGGLRPKLEVKLVPDLVVKNGTAERIEYHAEITNNLDTQGSIAWTATVIDDLGNEMTSLGSGSSPVSAKADVSSAVLSPDLPDGAYLLNVRAAIVAGSDEWTATGVQALNVAGGQMKEMSIGDWFTKTRSAQVIPIDGGTK